MRISTPHAKIWMSIKDRLDQWTGNRIMSPDVVFQPVATEAFFIVQNIGLDSGINESMGIDCGDELRGMMQISAMVPVGWTYAQHIALAGKMSDWFYPWSGEYDDAHVQVYARPKSFGAPRLDGGHNRIDVQIMWRCFA